MKVTLNWLKDFVEFDLAPEELAEKLTMVGFEVEEIIRPKRDLKNVVVGRVETVMPITASAQLKICQVRVGSETIQTICGAPNVRAQMLVAMALPGAELPGGMIVSHRNFDAYTSSGMICSEAELGLSERGDLVMELANPAQPGMNLGQYLGPGSPVLDLSITPNRPDCLSVIGIAREVAAIVKGTLRKPIPQFEESEAAIDRFIEIDIRDQEKCPRYCGRYFSGVTVAPSPWWLVERLQSCGIRPINNIVDITNYTMLETGQPLHAFDYDLIADHRIVVQTARTGDHFTTLDGKSHELTENHLMICDGQKPVALAGIMGGQNSEISVASRTIFLESAYFSPINIRTSSKQLGIVTESSMRFERGADPENAYYAINRAAQLICELAGARVARGVGDAYPKWIMPVVLDLRPERVNQVLGSAFTSAEMRTTLNSIGLNCVPNGAQFQVAVPTNRPDLTREIDLIEEIARLIGYDEIKPTIHAQVFLHGEKNKQEAFIHRLRALCVGMGFNESVTLSMLNPRTAEPFLSQDHQLIRLLNPLSEDLAVMRPSLVPSLLEVAAYNRNRQNYDLKLFELGSVYYLQAGASSFQPIELKKLVGIGTGLRQPVSWLNPGKKLDFYDAKGFVEHIFHKLSITDYQFSEYSTPILEPPGASIEIAGQLSGFIGIVHKPLMDLFDIKGTQVIVFEVDVDALYQAMPKEKRFTAISRYPTIPFDLAVVLDSQIPYRQVEQVIRNNAGEHLVSVRLFDTFEGKQIPKGKKSMAFSLVFGSKERTLGIDEVNDQVNVIISELTRELGAYLRTD